MIHERILAEAAHFLRHKPTYPGEDKPLEPVPYLRLPFTKEEYSVSEGWFYSTKVRKYVLFGHGAVDFALPYGHPVVAPFDGFAMSSYHAYPIFDKSGEVKVVNGISQRFGIGYFVQIYNPKQDRFIQLGHLSNIADNIPFSVPVNVKGVWHATGHTLSRDETMALGNPHVVRVKTGDIVGFVGYSGLTSEEDYRDGHERPYVIDPRSVSSWSLPHIHLDEFQRNYITGKKAWRRDPYDIYMKGDNYPTHSNKKISEESRFF